ncbi:MAG: hypothetical protein H6742_11615 [Alphaproteobacteria bacterium]|nr:hypothetical protein [Alphaproteobacteria bacterium]
MNQDGYESGLEDLFAVTDLPVLQDDDVALVWDRWDATWRDVYVLDGANETHAIFNLTEHNLADSANYAALYDLLVEAAGGAE